ncbi:MAG TPA: hypothetical protein DDZ51_06105, partial [Planctomycetaceae bacterium]|nr:hypothetical protein [Planctomycetaceae bacterium]
ALKSIQPDDWFKASITIVSKPDGEPSPRTEIAPFLGVFLKEGEEFYGSARHLITRPSNGRIVIFIDEITRANPTLLDDLLEKLENNTFLIEGRKYRRDDILFLFACNPAGMDSTCVTLSAAFKSRIAETWTLFNADIDVLADVYVPEAIDKWVAAHPELAPRELPSQQLIQRCVVAWQLLFGYPVDDRAAYANVPQESRQLIETLVAIDPELKKDLLNIGADTVRGPDARKPKQWLIAAMRTSREEVTIDALIRKSVDVLAGGFRLRFVEDQAKRLEELHKAVQRVVHRVLTNPDLMRRIDHFFGPSSLSKRVVDGRPDSASLDRYESKKMERKLEAALRTYKKNVTDERWTALQTFLAKVTEPGSVDWIESAAKSGFLTQYDEFRGLSDQRLIVDLAKIDPRFSELLVAEEQPRSIEHQSLLRELLMETAIAFEFAPEIFAAASSPTVELPQVVAMIDEVLAGKIPRDDELSVAGRAILRDAIRRIQKSAKPETRAVVFSYVDANKPPAVTTQPRTVLSLINRRVRIARRRMRRWAATGFGCVWIRRAAAAGLIMTMIVGTAIASDSDGASQATLFQLCGPMIWPLLALSVFAVQIAVSGGLSLRRAVVIPVEAPQKTCDDRHDELVANGSPLIRAIRRLTDSQTDGLDSTFVLHEEFDRQFRFVVDWLGTIAGIAPLVGLSGTVTGMILLFQAISQDNAASADVIARGMYPALMTSLIGVLLAVGCFVTKATIESRLAKLRDDATEILKKTLEERHVESS